MDLIRRKPVLYMNNRGANQPEHLHCETDQHRSYNYKLSEKYNS